MCTYVVHKIFYQVLHGIFTHLTTSDLKETRKVSRSWENVANTILRNRTAFSYFSYYRFLLAGNSNPSCNPDLIRRLSVRSCPLRQTGDVDGLDKSFKLDLTKFAEKYRDHIHQMYFFMLDEFYARWELGNVAFLKLKFLEIKVFGNIAWREIKVFEGKFNMPNLKVMHVTNPYGTETGRAYQALASKILEQAVNLENFRIIDRTNYFPDLSACKKLKYLELRFHPYKPNKYGLGLNW